MLVPCAGLWPSSRGVSVSRPPPVAKDEADDDEDGHGEMPEAKMLLQVWAIV